MFPPITVPGHVQKEFHDYLNSLPISDKEKGDICFDLGTEYGIYIRNNPDKALIPYSKIAMKNLITHMLNYNENYRNRSSNNISSINMYENTKLLLNNLINNA